MKSQAALTALLVLSGCGVQPTAPPVAKPTPAALQSPAPAPAAVDAAARLKRAVAAAFPKGTAIASDDPETPRRFADHRLIDAPFGPVLASYGNIEDGQETRRGVIAVHYLKAIPGGFMVVRAFPEAISIGQMGMLSDWAVSDKFLDLPALYAAGANQAEGYLCVYATLSELTPKGPVAVASFQIGYDDKGAKGDDGETIDGKIADIAKSKGFTVRYTGSRSFDEHYAWQGGRFVRQGGLSKMPRC